MLVRPENRAGVTVYFLHVELPDKPEVGADCPFSQWTGHRQVMVQPGVLSTRPDRILFYTFQGQKRVPGRGMPLIGV